MITNWLEREGIIRCCEQNSFCKIFPTVKAWVHVGAVNTKMEEVVKIAFKIVVSHSDCQNTGYKSNKYKVTGKRKIVSEKEEFTWPKWHLFGLVFGSEESKLVLLSVWQAEKGHVQLSVLLLPKWLYNRTHVIQVFGISNVGQTHKSHFLFSCSEISCGENKFDSH